MVGFLYVWNISKHSRLHCLNHQFNFNVLKAFKVCMTVGLPHEVKDIYLG